MSIAIPAQHAGPDPVRMDAARPRRLRQRQLSDTQRNFAIAMHLSPLAAMLFGPAIATPLILWLVRRDQSVFEDDHGREAVNAVISFIIYNIAAVITIVGIVALPLLYLLAIVSVIRGAVAASRGEYFRYPVTIRFLS